MAASTTPLGVADENPDEGAHPTSGPRPPAVDPAPPPDEPHLFFARGSGYPRAIAWLGFSEFWGHTQHLIASAIATENIDARDWMHCPPAEEMTHAAARALGAAPITIGEAGENRPVSLTERLGRDLWCDFISDTGDCADVSEAVAAMLFSPYEVEGEELPRGDILLFGGDTAYPVATEHEILNRVCAPFNRVLKDRDDGKPRVLMGIPGNHDWYDGLDGFARMFQARHGEIDEQLPEAEAERGGRIRHLVEWVEAFRVGRYVAKRGTLPLVGYRTVQNASYFALHLAPRLDLWAIDRQLRTVDFRQQNYFAEERDREAEPRGHMMMIADPAYAHLRPFATGQATLRAVDVDLERDGPLVLTGDTHHYCRETFGPATHVIAGGGGAFLHPACIARNGLNDPEAEFPGPRASAALALQVPWQIAGGRAGFVVHVAIGLLYSLVLGFHWLSGGLFGSIAVASAVVSIFATFACAMIGGWRQKRATAIALLALGAGVGIGGVPLVVQQALEALLHDYVSPGYLLPLAFVVASYVGTLGFGTFLMLLTLLGLEQHHAFSALAHPGYKHFVRLRVRRDGTGIDAWVFGKVDTLDPDAEVALVDRFSWENPHASSSFPDG